MKTLKNFKRKIQCLALAGVLSATALISTSCGGNPQATNITDTGYPPLPKKAIIAQKKVSELPEVVDYYEAGREYCNYYKPAGWCDVENPMTYIPPNITKDIVDSVNSLIQGVGGTFLANVDPNLDIVLIDNTNKLIWGVGAFRGNKILIDYKTYVGYRYNETLAHELGHSVDASRSSNEFISQLMAVASAFVIQTEHPWYFLRGHEKSTNDLINYSLNHLFSEINGISVYRAGAISTMMILNDYNGNFREAIKALANPDIFNYYFTSGNKLQGGYYSVIKEGAVIDGVVNNIAEIKCSGLKKLLKNNTNDTTLKEAKAQEIYSGYGFKYEVEKNVYEITSCNLFIIPYSDSPAERVISNDSLENGLDEIVVGQEGYPQ